MSQHPLFRELASRSHGTVSSVVGDLPLCPVHALRTHGQPIIATEHSQQDVYLQEQSLREALWSFSLGNTTVLALHPLLYVHGSESAQSNLKPHVVVIPSLVTFVIDR